MKEKKEFCNADTRRRLTIRGDLEFWLKSPGILTSKEIRNSGSLRDRQRPLVGVGLLQGDFGIPKGPRGNLSIQTGRCGDSINISDSDLQMAGT